MIGTLDLQPWGRLGQVDLGGHRVGARDNENRTLGKVFSWCRNGQVVDAVPGPVARRDTGPESAPVGGTVNHGIEGLTSGIDDHLRLFFGADSHRSGQPDRNQNQAITIIHLQPR